MGITRYAHSSPWNGIVRTIDPRISWAAATWSGANRGIFVRTIDGGAISKIAIQVGTASGNISLAAYRSTGRGLSAVPTGAPLATTGAIACPAAGFQQISLGTTIQLAPGDWLFMSCDNATATFARHNLPTAGIEAAFLFRQDSAHPAPTVGTLAASTYAPILVGVA